MANMDESNRWDRSVGLFEYETSHHDAYDDDDWKTSNFATDYIAKDQYTDGVDALLNLVVIDVAFINDPEIKILKMPSKKNKKIALGKCAYIVTLKCLVFDDSSSKAEDKLNKINEFVNRHDKMTDKDCYLVLRRYVVDTWHYNEWEDGSGNYDRKFLQCTLQVSKPKFIEYGLWEVNIQCEEYNL